MESIRTRFSTIHDRINYKRVAMLWFALAVMATLGTLAYVSMVEAPANGYARPRPSTIEGRQLVFADDFRAQRRRAVDNPDVDCSDDDQCGHGSCAWAYASTNGTCQCEIGYATRADNGSEDDWTSPCDYKQVDGPMVGLIALFVGALGVHRCVAASGVCFGPCCGGGICCGVVYGLTLGLVGIGALIDVILIMVGSFTDGNGVPINMCDD